MKHGMLILSLLFLSGCVTTDGNQPVNDQRYSKVAMDNVELASAYLQREQYAAALKKLNKALDYEPDYAPAHTVMAVLQERLGDMDKAGKHYRKAARLEEDNPSSQNNYGTYLCRVGEYEEADEYFVRAMENPLYRTPEVALSNAGACALDAGNQEKSELYLRKALEYQADYASALLPLAQIQHDKGDFFKARAFLQRYEAVGIHNAQSLKLGFQIENELGDTNRAQFYRDALTKRYPDVEI